MRKAKEEKSQKPCCVCLGIKATWRTIDNYWICDLHRGEMIRNMTRPR